ncbi:hypothetical protein FWH13_01240 [Candidatus Saccharibacteria bacterium]|nr:hypothetical protein [Candidatus Saccharibacteria bacterium]
MKRSMLIVFLVVCSALLLTACGGGGQTAGPNPDPNQVPVGGRQAVQAAVVPEAAGSAVETPTENHPALLILRDETGREVFVVSDYIADVEAVEFGDAYAVFVYLDSEGTELFAELTGEVTGRELHVFLGSDWQASFMVSNVVTSGTVIISTGKITEQQAEALADLLRSGMTEQIESAGQPEAPLGEGGSSLATGEFDGEANDFWRYLLSLPDETILYDYLVEHYDARPMDLLGGATLAADAVPVGHTANIALGDQYRSISLAFGRVLDTQDNLRPLDLWGGSFLDWDRNYWGMVTVDMTKMRLSDSGRIMIAIIHNYRNGLPLNEGIPHSTLEDSNSQ